VKRALLVLALLAQPAAAGDVADALRAGDLICEFSHGYRQSLVAELAGEPRRSDLLLVYEGVLPERAQLVSTQSPGRRTVAVRSTPGGVHFIEQVGPSVRMTSLTRCERSKPKNGAETCVRFTAQHAWHFDALAAADPDRALERLPSGAARGRCEPWLVD
jgi:hypothetical protein